ncbi:N-acetyltransferase [Pseudomonas sp. NCHU5208]|uniref:N-acetyltransferase n=1 Tax=unclassified Pseudomonas TaxID=196821 RepID=UPI003F9789C7
MIRTFQPSDSDAVLDLWLAASIQAHDFVPPAFWQEQLPAMREHYLPNAETLVLDVEGQILGFLSLHEQRLAALFISPAAQGRGLGRALLDAAKQCRATLELDVYRANARAVNFYQAGGFRVIDEGPDPHTGQAQLTMRWPGP